jgi:hypothetical protein
MIKDKPIYTFSQALDYMINENCHITSESLKDKLEKKMGIAYLYYTKLPNNTKYSIYIRKVYLENNHLVSTCKKWKPTQKELLSENWEIL